MLRKPLIHHEAIVRLAISIAVSVLYFLAPVSDTQAQTSCDKPAWNLPALYPAGPAPANAVVGDFDGDGHLDVAIGSYKPGASAVAGLVILLGDGSGHLTYRATLPIRTTFLAAADVDHDGRSEILAIDGAVATGDPAKLLEVGVSSGNFIVRFTTTFAASLVEDRVLVADFNGDRDVDLLLTSSSGGGSVLLGNGDGTFARIENAGIPAGLIGTGDLDGDGRDELVSLSAVGAVLTLERWDGARFENVNTQTLRSTTGVAGLVVADLNADGKADVGVLNAGFTQFDAYLSLGDFRLDSPRSSRYNHLRALVTDVDGDGKLDLIGEGDGYAVVVRGRGDGTLEPEMPADRFFVADDHRRGAAAVGDFNEDGHPDVVSFGDDGVALSMGSDDGTFGGPRFLPATTALAVADFNNDGRPDVLASDGGPGIKGTSTFVLRQESDGTFTRIATADPRDPIVAYTDPARVAATDFNGDGILDLIFSNPGTGSADSGSISRWIGNGDGTFRRFPQNFAIGSNPAAITMLDMNGDGILDVVITNAPGDLSGPSEKFTFALGRGDGTYATPQSVFPSVFPAETAAVGDLNGDGRPDLISAYRETIFTSVNDGHGGFSPFRPTVSRESYLTVIGIADFDRDGFGDALVAGDYDVEIWKGNGDGTFAAAVSTGLRIGQSIDRFGRTPVALVDLNNDGWIDIASWAPKLTVLINRGSLRFESLRWPAFGPFIFADINHDGHMDAVSIDGMILLNECDSPPSGRRRPAH